MKSALLKYLFLSISIYLFSSNDAYAAKYLTINYSAKAGESLKFIMLSFLKKGVEPASANNSLKLTMARNPTIKSWNPLLKDVTFKIFFNPEIIDLKVYEKYYLENKEKDAHHFSISTLPSIGYFSQSNNNGYTVKYDQISYFSLGLGYFYTPYKKALGMSASIYYSSISSTSNQVSSGGTTSVSIPGEYGVTLYGTYNNNSQYSFFTGLDFESFSSFNIQNILSNDTVVIDTNSVYYFTAGLNFKPNYMPKTLWKFSFSKSLFSGYSSDLESNSKVNISGLKFLLLAAYQINEKWSINGMFKKHSFSGDNDLSVNRFGAGITYSLF